MTLKEIEAQPDGNYENIQSLLTEYLNNSITIIPQFLFTASDMYEKHHQDATLLVQAVQRYLEKEKYDGLTGACLYQCLCTLDSEWSRMDDIIDYLNQFLSKNAKTLYEYEINELNKYFELLASSIPENQYLIEELVDFINVIPLLDDEHNPKDRFNLVDQLLLSAQVLVKKLKRIENEFFIDGNVLKLKYKGKEGKPINLTKGLVIIHKILMANGKDIDVIELDDRKYGVIDKTDGDPELETDYDGSLDLSDSVEGGRLKRIMMDIQEDIKDAEERVDEGELVKLQEKMSIAMKDWSMKFNKHGLPRKVGSPMKKSQENVNKLIVYAIKQIRKKAKLPKMAEHLDKYIDTGYVCRYNPKEPTLWKL